METEMEGKVKSVECGHHCDRISQLSSNSDHIKALKSLCGESQEENGNRVTKM